MPTQKQFPSSVEIKRVIAAARRAGIVIESVEIARGKVIIQANVAGATASEPTSAYDLWKAREAAKKAPKTAEPKSDSRG